MICFALQLGFAKIFGSISFSFMNGYLIENALCSDVICSRIAIGEDPPEGALAVSPYKKTIFFSPFSFLSHGKGETNATLAS